MTTTEYTQLSLDDAPRVETAPPHTLARRSAPATSLEAARALGPTTALQQAIWTYLREHGPCTDQTLQAVFDRYDLRSVTARRVELVRQQWVVDSGERGVTRAGRQAVLWRAVSVEEREAVRP